MQKIQGVYFKLVNVFPDIIINQRRISIFKITIKARRNAILRIIMCEQAEIIMHCREANDNAKD